MGETRKREWMSNECGGDLVVVGVVVPQACSAS